MATEWEQRLEETSAARTRWLEELFSSWSCRVGVHTSCGGLGFQIQPGSLDMSCVCTCHDIPTQDP